MIKAILLRLLGGRMSLLFIAAVLALLFVGVGVAIRKWFDAQHWDEDHWWNDPW